MMYTYIPINSSNAHKSKVALIRFFLPAHLLVFLLRSIQLATSQIPKVSVSTPTIAWVITIAAGVERAANNPLKLRNDGSITSSMEMEFSVMAIPITPPWMLNLRFTLAITNAATKRIEMES